VKENGRAVVLAAVNPLVEAHPWASLRKQAAEIELPLVERVASSVVAGEFDEVESIKKYEAASASFDYRKGEPRRRTFIGAVLIDGARARNCRVGRQRRNPRAGPPDRGTADRCAARALGTP
jgi:hypothetical protein